MIVRFETPNGEFSFDGTKEELDFIMNHRDKVFSLMNEKKQQSQQEPEQKKAYHYVDPKEVIAEKMEQEEKRREAIKAAEKKSVEDEIQQRKKFKGLYSRLLDDVFKELGILENHWTV